MSCVSKLEGLEWRQGLGLIVPGLLLLHLRNISMFLVAETFCSTPGLI